MRYRKKPVVIEAVQLTKTTYPDVLVFLGRAAAEWRGESPRLYIETPEGTLEARDGDWIIRGVKGEYYPCKPDIFAQTYDAVDGGPDGAP